MIIVDELQSWGHKMIDLFKKTDTAADHSINVLLPWQLKFPAGVGASAH